ncbi:multiheme c-type cytochrome [Paraflavitalea sp. CAU 1676]|uniref:multiheme c-type cytochrome n=1 Tax=Paraflavitalea sp. CAU 1676 TaxID=3032598 RepID=UPI0023DA0A71|nr:multiheme c-type cytochrome [Paraflavitalea sp. CAU 1676]MDF2187315.1 multiheme c-type cytochrome [Paraflavitalea sp. CAU 1676]
MTKRLLSIIILLTAGVAFFSQCVDSGGSTKDLRGAQYAGSSTCANCHRSVYDSYVSTAHFHTSSPATNKTVKGSFSPTDNVFNYTAQAKVVMEDRADGLFQTGYLNGAIQGSYPFDIAIGSGRKAQTYLYWKGGQYFQLPVSYFIPAHSWANSPGFPATHPKFDRVIPSTCFGCHSSMVGIKEVKQQGVTAVESFEDNQVIYGIDCERCHGPAATHVNFHQEHPAEKQAMHIMKMATLNNQAKLDQCALCHSGLKTPQKSPFEFKPGDVLTDYYYPDFTRSTKAEEMDVHGNQYQLFTASACFRKSKDMNCSSCHNPHTTERNNLAALSAKCMTCHAPAGQQFCTLQSLPVSTLTQRCIDCHMPEQASNKITLLTNGQSSPTPDLIRTHLIRVYPDETSRIMATLKKDSVGK